MSILAYNGAGMILGPRVYITDSSPILQGHVDSLLATLTAPQRVIYNAGTRFTLLCCGRRFGKTYLACTRLRNWAFEKPGGTFWYVTSTYKAAKRIAWKTLKRLSPPGTIAKINSSDLTITYINGATISLMGADQPDSLRGDSLSGCVIDEAAFVKPAAWYEVIRPALSDQQGPCWHLTTPAGFNHFHELWEKAEDDPDWSHHSYSTIEGGNVPATEIEAARRDLDARTFRQEYLASFEAAAGRVYYDFDKDNITDEAEDNGGHIYVGLDFNVSIMAGTICSLLPNKELVQWDEIAMPNSNTEEVAAYLKQRFPDRKIIAYPDPTGHSRKTSASAGVTDHSILRQHGIKVIAPPSPWAVKDKINATNAVIRTADGGIHYKVHPRCKKTIKALRGTSYKEGADEYVVDKKPGIEHWADGLGYLVLSACNRVKPYEVGGSSLRVS